MADSLPTVRPGDPLSRITAEGWNRIGTAVRRVEGMPPPPPRAVQADSACAWVLALNDTGAALNECSPVAVADVPADLDGNGAFEFRRRPLVVLESPADATAWVAVTLEPIPDGQVGRVAVAGVAVCNVEVTDVGHQYASPAAGDTTRLHSGATGSVRLLYIAAGGGSTRRCVVVVGDQVGDGTTGTGDPFELVTGNYLDGEYNWFPVGTDRVAADLDSGLWFRGGSLIALLLAQIDQAGGVGVAADEFAPPQDLGFGHKRVNGRLHLQSIGTAPPAEGIRYDYGADAATAAVVLWDVPKTVGVSPTYLVHATLRDGTGSLGDPTGVQYAVSAGPGTLTAALTLAAGSAERGVGTNLANWVGAGRPGLPGNHGFAAFGFDAAGFGWHFGGWGVGAGQRFSGGLWVGPDGVTSPPPPPPPPPPKSPPPPAPPELLTAPDPRGGIGGAIANATTRIQLADAIGRQLCRGDDGLLYEKRISGGVETISLYTP